MADDLKGCPFCGGAMMARHALWPSDGDRDGIIHASPTKCGLTEFSTDTADEGRSVAAAWNDRPSPALSLPSREACLAVCRSGKFETGQGTCAAICMQFLGDPRNSLTGCGEAERVHGDLVRAILETGGGNAS